jgi:hypothetical protein
MVVVNPASAETPLLNRLKGAVFALLGLVFVGIGVNDCVDTRDFVRHARKAEGIVIALNAGPAHPQVEYADETGTKFTMPGRGWISYRRGDRVAVLYLVNDPHHESKIDDPGALWDFVAIFSGLGATALLVGMYLMLRETKGNHVDSAQK